VRILILSQEGQGLGLAHHLSTEGHNVGFHVPNNTLIGKGVVDTKPSYNADITIFDSDSMLGAKEVRETERRVLGASLWAKTLAENPDYAKALISSLGWKTTESTEGANLYTTVWFNGSNYIAIYNSIVYRRFMSSGRGPDVNFTGVVTNFNKPTSHLFKTILKPLKTVLRKVNHRGCFHIHTLVKEQRVYVKSIDASFGHPLSYLLFENSSASVSDILLRLFNEDSKRVDTIEQWGCGLLLTTPPYPYKIDNGHTPLRGINIHNLKHLWLIDAQKNGPDWATAGAGGKIGYLTARGSTISEATRRIYRTIKNLDIKDIQYRDDVGLGLHRLLNQFKRADVLNVYNTTRRSDPYAWRYKREYYAHLSEGVNKPIETKG
jgi:hypothetical protein